MDSAEKKLIQIIVQDDRDKLVTDSKNLFKEIQFKTQEFEEMKVLDSEVDDEYTDQMLMISNAFALRLLRMCCTFDSVECAKALIDGEIGLGLQVNRMDESGRTALHYAAEMHSKRCVEMLLVRNARTDRRSKDDVALLPIELALSSGRMVVWDIEQTLGDLLANLSEMDLSVVKMLAEKTRDIADVAYANAIEGGIVPLAALLMVVPEKVAAPITILRSEGALAGKETATVYQCLVKEALSLGQKDGSMKVSRRFGLLSNSERRKLLLLEIELLQFFGAAVLQKSSTISPLIRASQAGDEEVVELLLRADIDVNETDADGNSALYWHIKKFPNAKRLRILLLLVTHGANVRQRNKLGMTPFHIAAANGYFQALQILLLKDPDNVDATTQLKETPLFFAIKHDFVNCAQLLMRSGADTKILNLCKQRPKDLARSQEMCFLLNQKADCWNSPIQMKESLSWLNDYQSDLDGDMLEFFLNPKMGTASATKLASSAKAEVCKYFEFPGGCARGSDCFYAHGEAEVACGKFQQHELKRSAHESKPKIFVGGLPQSVDSGTLKKFFEDQFGPVEYARVMEGQTGDQVYSRGFGFVTFKNKECFDAAVELHYVNFWGKRVEIKGYSILPEPDLLSEAPVAIPKDIQHDLISEAPVAPPKDRQPDLLPVATIQDTKQSQGAVDTNEGDAAKRSHEPMSWLGSLLNGRPRDPPRKKIDLPTKSQSEPSWLVSFKKWFPGFFTNVSKNLRKGEWYALSSVKTDFKTHCGFKLDHASAGYPKLSDFMRLFPGICRLQYAPGKGCHSVCHLILLPPKLPPKRVEVRQLMEAHVPSDSPSDDENDGNENYVRSPDSFTENTANESFTNDSPVEGMSSGSSQDGKQVEIENKNMPDSDPRSPTSDAMHPIPGGLSGRGVQDGGGIPLLLTLQSEKESFSYFTRHPTFFKEYREETLEKKKCFRCKSNKIECAARPCGHFLWCSECMIWVNKQELQSNKCVICDATVQRYIAVPWPKVEQQSLYNHAFPDLRTATTASRGKKCVLGKPLNEQGYAREVLLQI